MEDLVFVVSLAIKVIAIMMVLYTFYAVSEKKFPKLDVLEKYRLMRNRYEYLRRSLLFVVAIIMIQFIGLIIYGFFPDGTLSFTQLLISDIVFVILVIFLTTIYRKKEQLTHEMKKIHKKHK
jgi:archaellum biogenesis protein FlaJ (TadC family)